GDEQQVRKIVLEEVKPLADEVRVDALGNVLAVKKAKTGNALRVMLDAHMDEIGFMIVEDAKDGLFEFVPVGGIDARTLPGKMVQVGKDNVPGVIGAKPIHLTEHGETESKIPIEALRIDVGLNGGSKVKVGDRATFATRFRQVGPSFFAKALDDRLGVATLIELLRHAPENVELLCSFSVQEEIGLRGARVAAYGFDPDLAIAIDSTPALDLPSWDDLENGGYNTRLDAGPAIYITDSGTLSDPRLIRHLAQTGEQMGIPYQFRQPGGGGTDAGSIHRVRAGVPSVSISVPGRYAHTAIMVARQSDWQHTLALVYHALLRLDRQVLAADR
ncbi:MAG: M42 family peptidase, partial [Anaerolineae bacterium]|nr:M42 family peptidase [Anaerolineae bacterium]